jgi:2,3,4,5-tetrahydropyridine-2-carboxylate N-succinyltransferase
MNEPTTGTITENEIQSLRAEVEGLEARDQSGMDSGDARRLIDRFLNALESGGIRAASPAVDGRWRVHQWVKSGILAAFRFGSITSFGHGDLSFVDVDTLPPRKFGEGSRIRIVPGGTAVRRGAHLGDGTICMPPAYVNVGAFVGERTMVDSHALVGSCAQIGARVHLSAATQIGGVLEPVGALPVIVEDDVFAGGGCGIYEGCIVRRGAVLAPGVILSRSTPVFDLVNERILRAESENPLEIPEGAVVVPGSRPASSSFARTNGIALYAPVIVKYRDARTDAATALEQSLRDLN